MAHKFREAFLAITSSMKLVLPAFLPEPEISNMFFEISVIQMPIKIYREGEIG